MLAQRVNDPAALVLDLAGGLQLTGVELLPQLKEQLRHCAVGAADAAAGAHDQTGDQLLVGSVEHEHALVPPQLDVLGGHGGVLDAYHFGVFLHLPQQGQGEGHAGQLGDVVNDKVRIGGGGGDVVPIGGDGLFRQVEVDGGDGGDGVHTQALRVGGQGLTVLGVVAGHVGNDGHAALVGLHHVLQHQLALFHALVDALTGGAAHIEALDTLLDKVLRKGPYTFGGDSACLVVAGIEGGDNALVFFDLTHVQQLLHIFVGFLVISAPMVGVIVQDSGGFVKCGVGETVICKAAQTLGFTGSTAFSCPPPARPPSGGTWETSPQSHHRSGSSRVPSRGGGWD